MRGAGKQGRLWTQIDPESTSPPSSESSAHHDLHAGRTHGAGEEPFRGAPRRPGAAQLCPDAQPVGHAG